LALNVKVETHLKSRIREVEHFKKWYEKKGGHHCEMQLKSGRVEGNVKTLNGFGEAVVSYLVNVFKLNKKSPQNYISLQTEIKVNE
jgi:hypothetical protein